MGAVESNLDLIHSHIAVHKPVSGQCETDGKRSAHSASRLFRGQADQHGQRRGLSRKVWTVDEPGDIQPFLSQLSAAGSEQPHKLSERSAERRTTVSDISMGAGSGGGMSATEAHILQESATSPFATREQSVRAEFLEPLGRLACPCSKQFCWRIRPSRYVDFSGLVVACKQ